MALTCAFELVVILVVSYFFWGMIGNRDRPERKPEPWVRKINWK